MIPLTVLSFNLRYGTADDGPNAWPLRASAVLNYLRATSPHIMGLQEALLRQLSEIGAALPYHRRLGVGRDDGVSAGEHAAILYDARRLSPLDGGTFWLSPSPETPGSLGWGADLPRVCTWARFEDLASGARFLHLNTHLDHLSEPARREGVALVLSRVGAGPALLTGDFNVVETSEVIGSVLAAGLRDAHPRGAGTFHGFGPEIRAKIDFLFATPDVEVLAASVGPRTWEGRDLSDHLPVTATVAIPTVAIPARA